MIGDLNETSIQYVMTAYLVLCIRLSGKAAKVVGEGESGVGVEGSGEEE